MPLPERQLINRIRRLTGNRPTSGVIIGVGDDTAVLELNRGEQLLVTTDMTVEGVHFRRDWQSPQAVGHRALLRGLSDIAAMGGEPFAAFLSIAMPPNTSQAWFDQFLRGFLKLGGRYGIALAGGDTSAAKSAIVADISVLGRLAKGTAILRSGARPGDLIFVTGRLGRAAAALRKLRSGAARHQAERKPSLAEPRIALGRWLRENHLPTAMIDVSDGLSTDLRHICEESDVGAAIIETAIPHAPNASLGDALHGGEDYELLFTVPKEKPVPLQIAGIPTTAIGEIVRSPHPHVRILSHGKWRLLASKGWQHFRSR